MPLLSAAVLGGVGTRLISLGESTALGAAVAKWLESALGSDCLLF